MSSPSTKHMIIAPCFNESSVVKHFLSELEDTLKKINSTFEVVIVDDGSTDDTIQQLHTFNFTASNLCLTVLRLPFNIGHQGAIYQGLLYAAQQKIEYAIIMDSDGEDDPRAILDLLTLQNFDIVHVVRGKRREGLVFRMCYFFYKLIFRLVTHKEMNFGNYCKINHRVLKSVTQFSFIHFAAHLAKLKVKSTTITYDRRKRLDGYSKMNLSSLIHHGFRSFIEFAEELLMIFLKLFLIIAFLFIGSISYIVYLRLFTDRAILGWASTLSATLFTSALVCIGFFVIGILLINLSQNKSNIKERLYEQL